MPDDRRPAPEDILAEIGPEGRGKLTVFLGASAGVGKTYAMLEAAQEKLAEGVDVVIAWVETHGRRETEALLEGLPRIPPRELVYRAKTFDEMDVDAALDRHPELILVDELAHTNIVGSRHTRRFQDVEELLDAGIDVYTTVNIQHVESLNDVVAQITQISVRETVPDSLFERVSQVRLIDIPSEDLIRRLEEGKVYVADQATRAVQKFFRPGNINALRELALRFTAEAVDRQLDTYRRAHAIEGSWPARELVMACISPSPFSAQVVRTARRLATALKADWLVAYVERPGESGGSGEAADQLAKNLRLAEELGAEVVGLTGYDVPAELLSLARDRNATQIVIGKPLPVGGRRYPWQSTLVDKVIDGSAGMSVHVVPGTHKLLQPEAPRRLKIRPIDAAPYLGAVAAVALLTLAFKVLQVAFPPVFDLTNIALLYMLPVLFAAVRWGRGPSAFAAVTSVLAFDFFLVPPQLSFTVADLRYLIVLVVFLAVALITSQLASRLRDQARTTRRREERTTALYKLSQQMAAETNLDHLLNAISRVVGQSIDSDVVVFLPDGAGRLHVRAGPIILQHERDRAVADWAFNHNEAAGMGTESLAGADGLFVPVATHEKTLGVLGVVPHDVGRPFMLEQRQLLEAFASMAAVAILRWQLAAEAREAGQVAESERLRTALFNSVSHDLRTPLAAITGAVTSLEEEGAYDPAAREELIESIRHGAERMDHLVGNLLDTARIEGGMLKLNRDWCDLQDIIGVALRQVGESLRGHPLRTDIPDGLPLVRADFKLIEQVVVNLLYNAFEYSPAGSEVSITVTPRDRSIRVTVGDRGPGIPEQDRERVFDKFYRLRSPEQVRGTGLGLSICRALVEAHGGSIWADEAPGGGSLFTFELPLEEQPVVEEPTEREDGHDRR